MRATPDQMHATFTENEVRGAITQERSPKAREDYLQGAAQRRLYQNR